MFNYLPAYYGIKLKKVLNRYTPSLSQKIAPYG